MRRISFSATLPMISTGANLPAPPAGILPAVPDNDGGQGAVDLPRRNVLPRVMSTPRKPTPTPMSISTSTSRSTSEIETGPILPLDRINQCLLLWKQAATPRESQARMIAAGQILNAFQEQRSDLVLDEFGLSSLPDCLQELQSVVSLSISKNRLSTLPALPPGLKQLVVNRNRLTHLPAHLPDTIEILWMNDNPMTTLSSLPTSLQRLVARKTRLLALPPLPNGLVELDAGDSRLLQLPEVLPEGLVALQVADNNLTKLPALSQSLQSLQVSGNHLQVLPALPPGLNALSAARNQLVALPALPRSLHSLDVSANQLTAFPSLPLGLQTVIAHHNRIDTVPRLSRVLQILDLRSNPLAGTLPALAARLAASIDCNDALRQLQAFGAVLQPVPASPAHANDMAPEPGSWTYPENEENAAAFNCFQERLCQTADYQNPRTRPALAARVNRLVAAMRASAVLRSICFSHAAEAVMSCGDRVALGLNDMEVAEINHEAEAGSYDDRALHVMGVKLFRLHVVNQIAVARINAFKVGAIRIDEIEIRLAYQTALKKSLDLPGIANGMLYRASAGLTPLDIETAEHEVRSLLETDAPVQYLVQWQPWRLAMQRNHPQAYAALAEAQQASRNALSIMPTYMTEQQWMNALDELRHREEAQIHALTRRLTRQFSSASDHG